MNVCPAYASVCSAWLFFCPDLWISGVVGVEYFLFYAAALVVAVLTSVDKFLPSFLPSFIDL